VTNCVKPTRGKISGNRSRDVNPYGVNHLRSLQWLVSRMPTDSQIGANQDPEFQIGYEGKTRCGNRRVFHLLSC
jgi:hypothetical protein